MRHQHHMPTDEPANGAALPKRHLRRVESNECRVALWCRCRNHVCLCVLCVVAVAVLPWWTLITACDMWRAPGDFDEIRSREAAFLSCAGDADGAAVCGCSTEYQAVQTVSGACGLTPRLQLRLMFAGCACTYCQPAGVAQRVEADRRVAVGADFVRRRRRCFCAAAHC